MWRTRSEDGFAMMVVLGAIVLMTVVATGGYLVAEQALHDTGRVTNENLAFQVASSGLDRELAVFTPSKLASGYYTDLEGSTADGTYRITAQPLGAAGVLDEYVLQSTGRARGASETVSQRFFFLDLWGMNIGDGGGIGGGSGWNGNASITGPLYVRGDLVWTASATLQKGPLFVRGGRLDTTNGSGDIGTAIEPIYVYSTNGIAEGSASRVWKVSLSNSVPDITLPEVDDDYLDAMWEAAQEQSTDNILMRGSSPEADSPETAVPGTPDFPATKAPNASPYYKVIGGGSRSSRGAGMSGLTIDASTPSWGRADTFTLPGYAMGTGRHDDFAFDASTGTLYVEGTVFIDGPLTIERPVRYVGNGTLVCNGDIMISLVNVMPLNNAGQMSAEEALGFVSPGTFTVDQCIVRGAIFCDGRFSLLKPGTVFKGAVLCGEIYGDSPGATLEIDDGLKGYIPSAMPAAGSGFVFSSSWGRR